MCQIALLTGRVHQDSLGGLQAVRFYFWGEFVRLRLLLSNNPGYNRDRGPRAGAEPTISPGVLG